MGAVRLATLLAALVALLVAPAAAGAADPKPQTGKSVVVKRTGGVVRRMTEKGR